MTKAKYFERKKKPRQHYQDNILRRNREVRDLFNKLCDKNTRPYVLEFFMLNYFMNENAIYHALRTVDRAPVDPARASIQYLTAINEKFKL
jgi:hypothetical protein